MFYYLLFLGCSLLFVAAADCLCLISSCGFISILYAHLHQVSVNTRDYGRVRILWFGGPFGRPRRTSSGQVFISISSLGISIHTSGRMETPHLHMAQNQEVKCFWSCLHGEAAFVTSCLFSADNSFSSSCKHRACGWTPLSGR